SSGGFSPPFCGSSLMSDRSPPPFFRWRWPPLSIRAGQWRSGPPGSLSSPTAVVIVAIFWSWIWGPIGLILSTPLTLCLVVLGRHVRYLEFFDVLLGDRPALTPVETLYQRLLAGDTDEVLDQAEGLLKGRALSSY